MQSAKYYRGQAQRARRLASGVMNKEVTKTLDRLDRDYSDIAQDLESGAIDIVHPEKLPQQDHCE